jgi:hypothetical protein
LFPVPLYFVPVVRLPEPSQKRRQEVFSSFNPCLESKLTGFWNNLLILAGIFVFQMLGN